MALRAIPGAMDGAVVARIDADLAQIEAREKVFVALAIESGSRAWGFPSPDSDYDCRFIYVRAPTDYLALRTPRDVIETPVGPVFDVSGWDLQKALRLLLKGNAVVNEWLSSPIIYRGDVGFRDEMAALAAHVASPVSVARHYLRLGRAQFAPFRGEDGAKPFKKLFYALRPALALEWMARRPGCAAPPMNLQRLIAECELAADVADEIAALVALKARTREMGEGAAPARILALIERALDAGAARAERGDFGPPGDMVAAEAAANRLFVATLERFFGREIRGLRPQF